MCESADSDGYEEYPRYHGHQDRKQSAELGTVESDSSPKPRSATEVIEQHMPTSSERKLLNKMVRQKKFLYYERQNSKSTIYTVYHQGVLYRFVYKKARKTTNGNKSPGGVRTILSRRRVSPEMVALLQG